MRWSLPNLFLRSMALGITLGTIVTGTVQLPEAAAFIIVPDSVPWTNTASGPREGNGDPATLTWSLVPDGTTILGEGRTNLGGSDLIAFLNDTFAGDSQETDLTRQPWFAFFADSFDRWSQLSGVTYQYEPRDDGKVQSSFDGKLDVRGDIRIGGVPIDGAGGTLAFNFLPESGSDLVLDTDDGAFFGNASGNHIRLRNTLAHELGHGFGLQHINSNTDNLLLEPTISTAINGPQLDEVRGVQFYFGDALEKSYDGLGNDTAARATNLGSILAGETISVGADANILNQSIDANATDFVSLSNLADTDYYSFTITVPSQLNALLTPLGGTFNQASEGQTPELFDASARNDLGLTIFAANGMQILASANQTGNGGIESIVDLALPDVGSYFARVTGADDKIQLYALDLSVSATVFSPADINTDGTVDGTDLFLWRATFGSLAGADADEDGDSDGSDFLAWQRQFGPVPAPALATVPEPATLHLALLAVLLLGRVGRKKGTGVFCAKHPPGRSGKRLPSPFSPPFIRPF